MSIKKEKRHDSDRLADDLLYGAEEIGDHLGKPPRWVYHQQKNLGLTHIGATLVASKAKLKQLFS
jgi:hypothetical protein